MDSLTMAVRRASLACAITIALSAPGVAWGQSASDQAQDARIAQLENEVQALKQMVQQQQGQLVDARQQLQAATVAGNTPLKGPGVQASGALAPSPALAAGTPPRAPIQNTAIVAGGDSHFSFGGFIKLDMMSTWTSDGTITDSTPGRLFYFPAGTPVDAGPSDSYTDFHAQFSRIWFGVDRMTDAGDKLKGYVEFDFFGGGNNNVANEKFSNGYPPTLRHAYVQWNHWLAGQTWTNLMDLGSLPETVDFVGIVDGTLFARQAQIRYSTGNWSFSLENPQTWYQAGSPAQVSSGENTVPDVTARWMTKGDWGHFSVGGIARELRTRDDRATGFGLSVAGSFKVSPSDLFQYTVSGGSGLGRYLAFGLVPDAYLDGNGSLKAQDTYAGFAAWRHNWTGNLRSTLAYSAAYIAVDEAAVGQSATERTQSWRVNLIYSPFPRLDVGAELSWGTRELANDAEGELARLQTTVKYTF
ncbi:DcaP family trimeric outer membrane transporter [Pseudoxanthomonas sp. JBR18]|uniref:DcaP family trimeric outer membrane transporter n=1 Tax=Pseudoxanthomonas sp. JBR18 TaxID=2969308 RepID=UPI002304E4C1|nr:DcaP family trimeric outer membrane transporter [Pseudoxanthomonas sp. JBR18]WCE02654.1 DcaP family trimeric outer membrane transporter [Pseudoxanthomonas sp. JBR18]